MACNCGKPKRRLTGNDLEVANLAMNGITLRINNDVPGSPTVADPDQSESQYTDESTDYQGQEETAPEPTTIIDVDVDLDAGWPILIYNGITLWVQYPLSGQSFGL